MITISNLVHISLYIRENPLVARSLEGDTSNSQNQQEGMRFLYFSLINLPVPQQSRNLKKTWLYGTLYINERV